MVKRNIIRTRDAIKFIGDGQEQKLKKDRLIKSWIKVTFSIHLFIIIIIIVVVVVVVVVSITFQSQCQLHKCFKSVTIIIIIIIIITTTTTTTIIMIIIITMLLDSRLQVLKFEIVLFDSVPL